MSTLLKLPRSLQRIAYEEAAEEYLRSLPPEHFMESRAQATQRKITTVSCDLVQMERPDVHCFNEMLVQYPVRGQHSPGQVVPDNMLVISTEPIHAQGSFNVPLETARPFWVMEYVSKSNKRKDYEDSFIKYERHLKVPYYLIFYPDDQELTLYRHNGRKYVSTRPNKQGRYAVGELEIEIGLLDGWVRFWHRGRLLPLPAELQLELDAAKRQAKESQRRADQEQIRADQEQRRADQEQIRADQERIRADQEQRRAEDLQRRLDEAEFARRSLQEELRRVQTQGR